jgi:acyl dehydratase
MTLDPEIIGRSLGAFDYAWTPTDAQLYALGVGCGQPDPAADLAYTTENSRGVEQVLLPTFPLLTLVRLPLERIGSFDLSQMLHAEQGIQIDRELPVEATMRVESRIVAIADKGTAALVDIETQMVEAKSGDSFAKLITSIFLRGEGGFGGSRGATSDWPEPDTAPEHTVEFETRPEQALLYRLSGDRNPLHSDPEFARTAGLRRPILHGLCTLGFTARALIQTACDGDHARFGSMTARFSKPVIPGETLRTEIWRTEGGCLFRTRNGDGSIVVDRGSFGTRTAREE